MKISFIEELETLPAGTKPGTSHHRSPVGEMCRKRKRLTISLEMTREGHRQSDEQWKRYKGNFGKTPERVFGQQCSIMDTRGLPGQQCYILLKTFLGSSV